MKPGQIRMRRAVYPRIMTLREAKILVGGKSALGGFLTPGVSRYPNGHIIRTAAEARAEEDRIEREKIVSQPGDPLTWICGEFDPEDACSAPGCAYFSELLCDWPMGRGKTCDLPLCPEHAHSIGAERDLCEIHFREFQKRCGADRINAWPHVRGRR